MAKYALVENNKIVEIHYSLPKSWKNVSGFNLLKDDEATLNSLGWYKITKVAVDYDPSIKFISDYTYEFDNNQVFENPVFELIPITLSKTQEELFQEALDTLRIDRDRLIAESDWTQFADVQTIYDDEWKAQWAVYRQQLRDLPNLCISGEINIYEVEWPIKP